MYMPADMPITKIHYLWGIISNWRVGTCPVFFL